MTRRERTGTVRAARYYGKGDIRVEDVAEAQIREPDDVLIAPFLCGICGTDLHEYAVGPIVTPTSPHPLTGATLPQTLGHEFSAQVVEVGPARPDVRAGDGGAAACSHLSPPASAAGAGTAAAARATSA